VPNETPKTLIPLDEVVNWDGVLKSSGKLEGDHARLDTKTYCMEFGLEMFIGR
jgi:hypothetical protein